MKFIDEVCTISIVLGHDESVEVNQWALVGNVSVRYSGFQHVHFVNLCRTQTTLPPRSLRFDLKPRDMLIGKN